MGLYDALKDAISMAQKADNIELYRAILDFQKEALDLLNDNRILKDEITKLQEVINDGSNKEVKNECYYFKNDGPYCTKCYDDERKKILMKIDDNGWGKEYLICPKCDTRSSLIREYDTEIPFRSSKIDY